MIFLDCLRLGISISNSDKEGSYRIFSFLLDAIEQERLSYEDIENELRKFDSLNERQQGLIAFLYPSDDKKRLDLLKKRIDDESEYVVCRRQAIELFINSCPNNKQSREYLIRLLDNPELLNNAVGGLEKFGFDYKADLVAKKLVIAIEKGEGDLDYFLELIVRYK